LDKIPGRIAALVRNSESLGKEGIMYVGTLVDTIQGHGYGYQYDNTDVYQQPTSHSKLQRNCEKSHELFGSHCWDIM
jgi:hypothetical protein